MLDSLVVLLILSLSTVLSIVSAKTPLFQFQKKNLKIYKSGRQAVGLIIGIGMLSTFQISQNNKAVNDARVDSENKNNSRETRIRSDYAKTEVQMRSAYQSGIQTITDNYNRKTDEIRKAYDTTSFEIRSRYERKSQEIIKALADYRLAYDEGQKKIVSIVRDSMSKPLDVPHLVVCGEPKTICTKVSDNKFRFDIRLCNSNYLAQDVSVDAIWLFSSTQGPQIFRTTPLFGENKKISPNGITHSIETIEFLNSTPKIIYTFILMRYKNSSNKEFTNTQLICWELSTQLSIDYDANEEIQIISVLKSKKIL